ncbi:hypothetical protein TBLA_0E05000 [Henningerozyma blattae CBS 6284]|uniref:Thioesterase domain-containing protein n=1 Tax=Henningerozyma blattae (strain ATCC 34711 / CBS 6284 / DSM 70876 / NBRC 10599 / NRRL Y-10934 / UCD 77-7) TaxID=1071380 RepID=I2H597_HENB6|nr:hypothetical protein TBLA_0E05000 [Tetrapisispora blattae CBS 6284]CCH61549.1 hypothetical protein TBLA_0E05000 [Tetrapisispora blattae CBS 6284]
MNNIVKGNLVCCKVSDAIASTILKKRVICGSSVSTALQARYNSSQQGHPLRKAEFTTAGKKRSGSQNKGGSKWISVGIFGTSFIIGWYFTQHMTFADLMAWWRYDKLPVDSDQVRNYKSSLEYRAEKLSIINQLKTEDYLEIIPTSSKSVGLIDDALSSPGAIAIPPKFYYNPKTKNIVGVYHLGMKLTGYPFIVHGGILATIMEDLMRQGVQLVKSSETDSSTIEKTKKLQINYKFPTFANQFVIVRTTKVEEFGKNLKLHVEVVDQDDNRVLAKGNGIFTVQ